MLNGSIFVNVFKIDCESKRIEDCFEIFSVIVVLKRKELNRKEFLIKRREYENKICKVLLLKSDIIFIEYWEFSFIILEKRLNEVKEEVCNWREKYDNLEKEKEVLFDEIMFEVLVNCNDE